MVDYIAAIEQSSLVTRCSIVDRSGKIQACAQKEHRQIYLLSERVEQQPLEIWKRVQEVIKATLAQMHWQKSRLVAIGIANQRETTIVWNRKTGTPYYNAIAWQDTRTRGLCQRLSANGLDELFQSRTGLPLEPYFSGPKIQWILDNVSGVRQAANQGEALFGTIDSWLIWWLTGGPRRGVHVMDVTNASRTLLFNLDTLDWDDDLLKILNIPRQMLPRIVSSSDPVPWGVTGAETPFGQAIPVCGDLGDQQAALVGQACFQPGEAKCSFSTASFVQLNTGPKRVAGKQGLLTTIGYRLGTDPVCYALEGSISFAEALLHWLHDGLGILYTASEIGPLAQTVNDNGGIAFLPPGRSLYAPYWTADARGWMVGIHPSVARGNLARAAAESIAFQLRQILDAMRDCSGSAVGPLKVDGSLTGNSFLMELLANLLGVAITRPKKQETVTLGAAAVAGLAAGFWSSCQDLRKNWQAERCWQPTLDPQISAQMYQRWLDLFQEGSPVGHAEVTHVN
jgi:glycerol kinase